MVLNFWVGGAEKSARAGSTAFLYNRIDDVVSSAGWIRLEIDIQ
jgi:hypothetical protein